MFFLNNNSMQWIICIASWGRGLVGTLGQMREKKMNGRRVENSTETSA